MFSCRSNNDRNKGHRPWGQDLSKELTKDYLYQEYLRKQRSMIDIAKELGCTRQTIFKALRKFGIDSRSLAEASDLAIRGGKKRVRKADESRQQSVTVLDKIDVNESLFSCWSVQMAYV